LLRLAGNTSKGSPIRYMYLVRTYCRASFERLQARDGLILETFSAPKGTLLSTHLRDVPA
jgi:hypothetical protein